MDGWLGRVSHRVTSAILGVLALSRSPPSAVVSVTTSALTCPLNARAAQWPIPQRVKRSSHHVCQGAWICNTRAGWPPTRTRRPLFEIATIPGNDRGNAAPRPRPARRARPAHRLERRRLQRALHGDSGTSMAPRPPRSAINELPFRQLAPAAVATAGERAAEGKPQLPPTAGVLREQDRLLPMANVARLMAATCQRTRRSRATRRS